MLREAADLVRAAGTEDEEAALAAMRAWLSTEEGRLFLIGVSRVAHQEYCEKPGLLGLRRVRDPMPRDRVVVPLRLQMLGDLLSSVVGLLESEMSVRELAVADDPRLGWAEWDPVARTLEDDWGVCLVVPREMSLGDAALALLGARSVVYPSETKPIDVE